MALAIGMIELSSIARGIDTCDYMVKAAQVDLLRASTVCPGKYIIIVAGDTGDVRASMAEGRKRGAQFVVDELMIPARSVFWNFTRLLPRLPQRMWRRKQPTLRSLRCAPVMPLAERVSLP